MRWRSSVQLKATTTLLVILMSIFALGFMGYGIYLALTVHFSPEISALLTALVYLFFATLTLLVAKLLSQVYKQAPRRHQTQAAEEFEILLEKLSDPELSEWIKKHPGKSVAATLMMGVVVGYSDEARSLFKTVCRKCMDDSQR
jgi:lysylphosphatidylglycerol synthetase-like protein (DUF2156 family)